MQKMGKQEVAYDPAVRGSNRCRIEYNNCYINRIFTVQLDKLYIIRLSVTPTQVI